MHYYSKWLKFDRKVTDAWPLTITFLFLFSFFYLQNTIYTLNGETYTKKFYVKKTLQISAYNHYIFPFPSELFLVGHYGKPKSKKKNEC